MDRPSGKLFLFYIESVDCMLRRRIKRFSPGGSVMSTHFDEKRQAWSPPRAVYSQEAPKDKQAFRTIPKVLANKPAVLRSGEWVLPLWTEAHGTCGKDRTRGAAAVLVSDDMGVTWQRRGHIKHASTWLIENTLEELTDGRLMMLFRTTAGKVGCGEGAEARAPVRANAW